MDSVNRELSQSPGRPSWRDQAAALVSMFHAPRRTLAGLRNAPALAGILIAVGFAGALDSAARLLAEDTPALAEAMAEQSVATPDSPTSGRVVAVPRTPDQIAARLGATRTGAPLLGFLAFVGLATLLSVGVTAGFFWLFPGILGVSARYRTFLSTVAHASWPALAATVLLTGATAGAVPPETTLALGVSYPPYLAAAFPALDGQLAEFAARLDPLLIWQWTLLAVGFTATLGVSPRRAAAVAFAGWSLGTAVALV